MSHYLDVKTQITDVEALVAALCRVETKIGRNWTVKDIEVHEVADNLVGYHGDRRAQKANLIIRRHNVQGAANDIGFVKQADGTYSAIVSEYDSGNGYGKTWQQRLMTFYAVEKAKRTYQAKKIKYVERTNEKGLLELKAYLN